MFTGLVEELAQVVRVDVRESGANIELNAKHIMNDMNIGDSIAVNGVCLTVVKFNHVSFTLDAVPETIKMTNLSELKPGNKVHVERAMAANGRFGGHIVSGHIDGVGLLQGRNVEGIARVLTIAAPSNILRYVVSKGSICVNGVSLTVMDVASDFFRISIIPHTGLVTTLGDAPVGSVINLECDVLAKYVEKMLQTRFSGGQTDKDHASYESNIDIDFLAKHGFV